MHLGQRAERLERVGERAGAALVRDDVQRGAVAVRLLQEPRDRDVALRKLVRDARERAGPVLDGEAEVERRRAVARRQLRQLRATRRRSAGSPCPSSRSR